ncbi:hypothetical protein [Amycolatopsis sp. NPDC051903]|uniref:hypothetical protein n=1 Tax=Amycolatopsis sp. NPDC051903 TaxID=3363936 RepID=UPI00378DD5DE
MTVYQLVLPANAKRWTIRLREDVAAFSCTPPAADHAVAQALPRVWNGRGLGLPAHEVPTFAAALGEIMKQPVFWRAYSGAGRCRAQRWAEPHVDPEDGFVYVSGPCRDSAETVGYRPVESFTIALANVRGLRIRMAAHLSGRLVVA